MRYTIYPSPVLEGSLVIPPSKSHTLRALLFGCMATGMTRIKGPLNSPDTLAMIQAIEALGARVRIKAGELVIQGVAGKLRSPTRAIDAKNSGLVFRLIGALASLLPTCTMLTGDHSIQKRRVIKPLLDGLCQLGASATSSRLDDRAPIFVRGPLLGGKARIEGADSQPVSGMLIAAAFGPKKTTIFVHHPGETPWIDMTLHWLDTLGLSYEREGYEKYTLQGKGTYPGFSYTVPGDLSSCAYPLAASLVTKGIVTLKGVDCRDVQGDRELFFLLQKMGALFTCEQASCVLTVAKKPALLTGRSIDVNPIIDALPILAVLGCYAKGRTVLYRGKIARQKECDRIACMVKELKKMGAYILEREDGLIVHRSKLKGADLDAHGDHRVAMALVVAALFASAPSTLSGAECVAKTYPSFFQHFTQLGAKIFPS